MNKLILIISVLFFSFTLGAQVENIPLLTVTGEGVVKTEPDLVLITISFSKTVHDKYDEIKYVQRIFETMDTKVRIFGLNNSDHEESLIFLNELNSDHFYKQVFIELYDINKLEMVLLEIKKQNLQVNLLEYTVTNRKKKRDEARKKAVLDAEQKARGIASGLGQNIGKAHTITEIETIDLNWYNKDERYLEIISRNNTDENLHSPFYYVIYSRVSVSFDLIKN